MPADEYHRHEALSSSGARKLLPPSCPALFKYERDNPQPTKRVFEIGHAAHKSVLGVGPELVLVDADRWDTKAIKEQLAEIRAAGGVPLKRPEFEQVQAMAKALREHPYAGALFDPERGGKAEQNLFWTDAKTGVDCRARVDWLPRARRSGRLILPDYKSADKVDRESIDKALHNYGYAQQATWYLDAVTAVGLAESVRFLFVAQMKTPPYLVTVAEVDAESLQIGRDYNDLARRTFADCIASGRWPGFSDDGPIIAGLPGYARNRYYEETGK
ncbi:MAG: hypothetical protein HOV94_34565 [Saccharothrix sp.]|nr:hypothetical protein [Saccharothrix sp.]